MYPPGYIPPYPARGESPAVQNGRCEGPMREKMQTRLRRDAVFAREQALRLMQRAEKMEQAAQFLDNHPSEIEVLLHEALNN